MLNSQDYFNLCAKKAEEAFRRAYNKKKMALANGQLYKAPSSRWKEYGITVLAEPYEKNRELTVAEKTNIQKYECQFHIEGSRDTAWSLADIRIPVYLQWEGQLKRTFKRAGLVLARIHITEGLGLQFQRMQENRQGEVSINADE